MKLEIYIHDYNHFGRVASFIAPINYIIPRLGEVILHRGSCLDVIHIDYEYEFEDDNQLVKTLCTISARSRLYD